MLFRQLQHQAYSSQAGPHNSGTGLVAGASGACEYGNWYYWWYYYAPTSHCHAPEKER